MMKKSRKHKKVTLNELGSMLEHVIHHMVTKDDIKELDDRLTSVESKVDGINRRLDTEAIQRADQKLPERMSNLEIELFGASKAPKTT